MTERGTVAPVTTFAADGTRVTETPVKLKPGRKPRKAVPPPEPAPTITPAQDKLTSATAAEPAPDVTPAQENADKWAHEWINFEGDDLGIRIPTPVALTGFALATGNDMPDQIRSDKTGLFLLLHLSPKSYNRVIYRMMDPDDTDYTIETIGALARALATIGVDAIQAAE